MFRGTQSPYRPRRRTKKPLRYITRYFSPSIPTKPSSYQETHEIVHCENRNRVAPDSFFGPADEPIDDGSVGDGSFRQKVSVVLVGCQGKPLIGVSQGMRGNHPGVDG